MRVPEPTTSSIDQRSHPCSERQPGWSSWKPTVTITSFSTQLLDLPDGSLSRLDIAIANLACASGLPGTGPVPFENRLDWPMYADLGPGQMIDLDPPSPNGIDLLYSHEYVANRLRSVSRRSGGISERANLYGYVVGNPINLVDPFGLFACAVEEECSGACFIGKKTTITKCEFTKVKVEEGSNAACSIITSALICSQLKSQFAAANKAAGDPKKFPDGTWLISKCTEGCDCKGGYVLKKGPQKFELKDRTIKSTGSIRFVGEITCVVTVSGTVEVDGDGFALVECEKAKK